MANSKITERLSLTVVDPGDRNPFGSQGKTVRHFKATIAGAETPLLFNAYSTTLDQAIAPGATFEADVVTEVKETERGTFTNRHVNQIYIDGAPVRGKGGSVSSEMLGKTLAAMIVIWNYRTALGQGSEVPGKDQYDKALSWCNTALAGAAATNNKKAAPAFNKPGQDRERLVNPEELNELVKLMAQVKAANRDLVRICNKENKWNIATKNELKLWQYDFLMDALKKGIWKATTAATSEPA